MCTATSRSDILILVNVRWWNANAFYAVNLARILHRRGHRVWVGCASGTPANTKARQWGLPVVDLDFAARNPLVLIRSFGRLLKFIRHEGIRVINSHRPEDSTFGWLARILTGTRHVVTRGDQRQIGRGWPGRLRYQQADAVVLTCRALRDRNREVLEPIADKVSVIHGSTDEQRFAPPPASTAVSGKLIVGWVGRLDPVKDPDTFLRAAARAAAHCKQIHFVLAGSPANIPMERISHRIRQLNLGGRMTLLPRVADITVHMAGMDLGVITSTGSEVISRVLLEFLALGKPVMGTRVNAIGEIIRPGSNGELFDPEDDRALARLLVSWADTPRQRRTYAAGARQSYLRHYTEDQVYRQYRQVLDRVAS